MAPKLNEMWGQPLVIENRPGAGGAFAAATVAKAVPDGYTLLMLSSQFSIGAAVHKNLPYDAVRDFAGVTQIGFSTNALIVSPSLGVENGQGVHRPRQLEAGADSFSAPPGPAAAAT